jgi:uncharacterized protein (DUF2132 family)
MSDEVNYQNNPLHGLSLKSLLTEIIDHYGFEILHAYLNINCFKKNPSLESSVKFLKKTEWAREKVESFYLYQFKSLPRASDEQFALSPRDRIIPDGQVPGEPASLSLEDAERLNAKRASRSADYNKSRSSKATKPYSRKPKEFDNKHEEEKVSSQEKPKNSSDANDPWAKWR